MESLVAAVPRAASGCGLDDPSFFLFGFVIDHPQLVEPVRVPLELLVTLHRVDVPRTFWCVSRRFARWRRLGRTIRSCRCLGRSFGIGLYRRDEGRTGAIRRRCGTRRPSLL
jgi:hypothetical protein